MDITAPFMLRSDVLLVPVADLDEQVRATIECENDDVALTRPRSRTTSIVVEAAAARLVEQFRKPCTLVEALVLYGRREGVDPDTVLESAYALMMRLLQAGFIVPAEDGEAIAETEDGPLLAEGAAIDGAVVVRPLYVLEDTDVYLARTADDRFCALKLQRPGSQVDALFLREAEALRRLDGAVAPRLERAGEYDGRPYLLMEWCCGIDAEAAAMEQRGEPDERTGVLRVLRAIADAYAELHRRGVLHGDVHTRNVLILADGSARLVDFGFAVFADEIGGFMRGGIPFYYEPEFARAGLDGTAPPAATAAGEQYALAALLYQLVTGAYYVDFSMGRETMLREIMERPPVPFIERGIEPWPELEAVLFRALSKDPADRYPSVAAFSEAVRALAEPLDTTARLPVISPLTTAADTLVAELGFEGERLFAEPERGPTASVNYGAAGVAYALLRMATAREDAQLLSLADAWCTRAEALAVRPDAFQNEEIELTAATIGTASPLHGRSGVAAVRALVGRALADDAMQSAAAAEFADASAEGHRGWDLALGRTGSVLGAALMLDALPRSIPREPLLRSGREHLDAVWRHVGELGDIASSQLGNLGIAHGWAGFLYAALQWHRASGDALCDGVADRLEQLARLASPASSTRGISWPWSLRTDQGPSTSMPGWCNGTAGHVALWCLAHELLGEPRYLQHALGAAWDVWDAPDAAGSLCCGLVGRSYALLRLHRLTRDDAWLRRARRLGERAAGYGQFEEDFPLSLYKGRIAIAMLAADLERPDSAAHPFFEEERWPPSTVMTGRITLGVRPSVVATTTS